jgi:copper chaperone CopZ
VTDVTDGSRTTTISFNTAGAPTVEFSVPDMMCPESCAVATREILESQPGVQEVLVDFETKSATVAVDEEEFQVEVALEALADRGFVHSEVKTVDAKAADVAEPASPSDAQPAG